MTDASGSRIRVAIIGGGLAGTTVANALIQIPHLEVQVYESAPTFSERGAAVGFDSHALGVLELILPGQKDEILKKAKAVALNSVRNVMGSGPSAGQIVADLDGEDSGVIVHRASLLRELVARLPKEALHTDKKLAKLDLKHGTGAIQVTFYDGTTSESDVVIGADGIFSTVRSHVLQDSTNDFAASPAGFWDSRILVPFEKAKAILGAEKFEVDRQCGYIGDGAFVMHDVLEDRTVVQCIISAIEREPTRDRKRALTRESLTKTLGAWLDGPIGKEIIELSLEQQDLHGYSQWEHKATPTYSHGNTCLIGDAAHAMTPWQGSGAAMAFEDVAVLQELLRNTGSPADICAALKAYDMVRRPRCQRVINSSRETGIILCGKDAKADLDPQKIGEALAHMWDFIMGLDMRAHRADALKTFREMDRA
ncbi:hypothetical protein KVR01_007001 [Diaporthe batatas]|uniref:uncharacterized protein n=1 Tax=Diaporthe batatas TaxID=748121 RepID=UPI001D04994F|nr:uncharacterized protein KVR01_007001 [Diaporthe batatas]KAG8163704.1 hypothetical protein KVR01_007001 [Diaporthe batatas]